jgi:hypothetical protein
VVDGQTFTWTWPTIAITNSAFEPRLRIRYRLWGSTNANDETIIYLPLTAPSADLTLEADPAGPVAAGTPVTFTPVAEGAELIEVLEWEWVAADTVSPPNTLACGAGTNPCITSVHESGSMLVRARVDGQLRTATAAIAVEPQCPPMLDDADLRADLRERWEAANPYGPVADRRERVGWIRQDGTTLFLQPVVPNWSDPCSVEWVPQAPFDSDGATPHRACPFHLP